MSEARASAAARYRIGSFSAHADAAAATYLPPSHSVILSLARSS